MRTRNKGSGIIVCGESYLCIDALEFLHRCHI